MGLEIDLPEARSFAFSQAAVPLDRSRTEICLDNLPTSSSASVDAELSARFTEQVFGFRVSNRTKGMIFVRCKPTQDIDAVMRGIGRMRVIGISPAWWPRRHGPGNNVFSLSHSLTLSHHSEVRGRYKPGDCSDIQRIYFTEASAAPIFNSPSRALIQEACQWTREPR